jgi:hypothetical protein
MIFIFSGVVIGSNYLLADPNLSFISINTRESLFSNLDTWEIWFSYFYAPDEYLGFLGAFFIVAFFIFGFTKHVNPTASFKRGIQIAALFLIGNILLVPMTLLVYWLLYFFTGFTMVITLGGFIPFYAMIIAMGMSIDMTTRKEKYRVFAESMLFIGGMVGFEWKTYETENIVLMPTLLAIGYVIFLTHWFSKTRVKNV